MESLQEGHREEKSDLKMKRDFYADDEHKMKFPPFFG